MEYMVKMRFCANCAVVAYPEALNIQYHLKAKQAAVSAEKLVRVRTRTEVLACYQITGFQNQLVIIRSLQSLLI